MKYISIFTFFVFFINLRGNDATFTLRGNQLIPIMETDINVQKEVLTIRRIPDLSGLYTHCIEVTVYYEFFNPQNVKTVTVGFEASPPSGAADFSPSNGGHPYIRDFTIEFNGEMLNHKIAYIQDSVYTKSDIIKSKKLNEILESMEKEEDYFQFDYNFVYYFEATFKPGKNIVKHTYNYYPSSSTETIYEIDYILTAANRWGNKQIDDFTLIIDMGEFQSFRINKGFFRESVEWQVEGSGKIRDIYIAEPKEESRLRNALEFNMQNGAVVFRKTNFKPESEIYLYAIRSGSFTFFESQGLDIFNFNDKSYSYIPFSYESEIMQPEKGISKKILQNVPYAKRGYVFKDKMLQSFFEKHDWYFYNHSYTPKPEDLYEFEKKWLQEINKN